MAAQSDNTKSPPELPPKSKNGRALGLLKKYGGVLVVIVAILIFAGLVKFLPPKDETKRPVPPEPIPVYVEVIKPLETLEDNMELYGRIEPDKVVEVAGEISARVRSYAGAKDTLTKDFRIIPSPAGVPIVKEGDRVVKDQPLMYLDTDLALAARDQAKADYDFKLLTYNRVKTLVGRNVATSSELDQCTMALDVAKAQLEETEALLERTFIVVPISGILNKLPVDPGEYVLPGKTVAEIVDMDTVDVIFDIPERDIGHLKIGGKATILHGPQRKQKTEGVIKYISALADPSTRTTVVKVAVDNSERKFHTGQFVMAKLTRRVLKDVIMVPHKAIIPMEGDKKAVYVARDGKAVRVYVEIAPPYINGTIQVTSGLKKGDWLITSGSTLLEPDREINVLPAEDSEDTDQPTAQPAIRRQ